CVPAIRLASAFLVVACRPFSGRFPAVHGGRLRGAENRLALFGALGGFPAGGFLGRPLGGGPLGAGLLQRALGGGLLALGRGLPCRSHVRSFLSGGRPDKIESAAPRAP